jgi:hypothetical protein
MRWPCRGDTGKLISPCSDGATCSRSFLRFDHEKRHHDKQQECGDQSIFERHGAYPSRKHSWARRCAAPALAGCAHAVSGHVAAVHIGSFLRRGNPDPRMSLVGLGCVKTRRCGEQIEWTFRQITIRVMRILKRGQFRSIRERSFFSFSSFRGFHTAWVISLGGDRGQGPVYVRSTSDRVEILCTAVKDAKCHKDSCSAAIARLGQRLADLPSTELKVAMQSRSKRNRRCRSFGAGGPGRSRDTSRLGDATA